MRKAITRFILFCLIACMLAGSAATVAGLGRQTQESTPTAAAVSSALAERAQAVTDRLLIEPEEEERADLPEYYDYREEGRSVPVRDQGQHGTCWAFAGLTALETSLMPEVQVDFSRDHLNYHNDFQMEAEAGGSFIMSMSYLTAWKGPVLEADDPYGDGSSPDDLTPAYHVQEVRIPKEKDYETIKQTVYRYGGVESSLYMDFQDPSQDSAFYSEENASYCYGGTEEANHDVVIIGWDDTYPAENFKVVPEGDGAFICQNSWGTEFGDGGIFYVSYYDVNIGGCNAAYTRVEAADNYDILHQSDLCGWCGQLGYGTDTAYFANVYTAEEAETLRAVGFYSTDEGTEYRLAVIPDFTGTESLVDVEYQQSGYLEYEGYYTVDLDTTVNVAAGSRFAVLVQIRTPDSEFPIAVEYSSEAWKDAIVTTDGEGYISPDGQNSWERIEETQGCNLCLKVYADRQ